MTDKEIFLDEFLLTEEKILVPASFSSRAHTFTGQSEDCPYNKLEDSIYFSKDDAETLIAKKEADYCWNSCHIEDCPAYKAKKS